MKQIPLSPRRVALGIALISVGLALLMVIPHPLGVQAPFNDLLPSLATIFLCVVVISLGVFVLGIGLRGDLLKDFTRIFLMPMIIFGGWIFLVVLPLLLLSLSEEVAVLILGSSLILLVLFVGYFERGKEKHKKSIEKEQR